MFSLNEKLIEAKDKVTKLHSVPLDVADDMIGLLDSTDFFNKPALDMTAEEYINSHRVIDISCKSGSLLYSCYSRFMLALRDVFPDRDDRELFILRYLLYGLCPDKRYLNLIRNTFYNNQKYDLSEELGNFYHYDFKEQSGVDSEEAKELLENMKFDVVCGNPPYNDDIYLDFVRLGHRLAKSYDLWITPAKFWAKTTCDTDKKFRDMINDFGDSFVVYKNCKDIFNISEPGGIAYYLLDKNNKNSKYRIKCIHKNSVAFQSDFEEHEKLEFLPLHTLNILNKLGRSNFKDTLNLLENMYINRIIPDDTGNVTIMQGKNVYGYVDKDDLKTLENLDMYKCIQNCICGSGSFQADDNGAFLGMPPVYIIKPYEIGKGSFHHLRFFNTLEEANHFVEFMSTKLVNFAYTCGLCGTTNSAEFYRYIPDPGSFDKVYEDKPLEGYTPDENGIYTDKDRVVHCSLYAKYKLTDEEINVIESVIRERK